MCYRNCVKSSSMTSSHSLIGRLFLFLAALLFLTALGSAEIYKGKGWSFDVPNENFRVLTFQETKKLQVDPTRMVILQNRRYPDDPLMFTHDKVGTNITERSVLAGYIKRSKKAGMKMLGNAKLSKIGEHTWMTAQFQRQDGYRTWWFVKVHKASRTLYTFNFGAAKENFDGYGHHVLYILESLKIQ